MLNLHLPRAVGAWLTSLTGQRPTRQVDAADTVMHWPPTPARVLVSAERHAHKCLAQALALEHPKGYLLAHVPLHKVVRVPKQYSYREWLSRTGLLTVDFALCDEHGYIRSAVLLPVGDDHARQSRKRDRLLRVLGATELKVTLWDREWQNDTPERLRERLFPRLRGAGYYADLPHAAH
ncbi:hypothetical protein [Roseateles sp. BYS87W]|uniref:DUF2726 domain-containing protein n=1 Tax=Pelomonas baiyunensis TaxID=3299026 RepID=A0ABW7GU09_9BURK